MSKRNKSPMHHVSGKPDDQKGVVAPLVAIGLLAILAVAGLALDSSHALANKTRMQNTVDAAALAAAKVLDQTEDTAQSDAAAFSLMGINASGSGNHELDAAYDGGEINVLVQYSTTAVPFLAGAPNGPFVRVIADGFETATSLSQVLGFTEIPTPASAVAGPSGPLGVGEGAEICDVAPIAVCPPAGGFPVVAPGDPNPLHVLKPGGGNHAEIGPGNYKMLRLGCNGGNCLRQNLAGDYGGCAILGDIVETEPGISSGPTSQGFNTRFNLYQGGGLNSDDYPPDLIVTDQSIGPPPDVLKACEDDTVDPPVDKIYLINGQGNNYCNAPVAADEVFMSDEINYSYQNSYVADSLVGPFTDDGVKNRRLLTFPIVNCDGNEQGQSQLDVTGFACFFMLQPLETGQADGAGKIIGEYVGDCEVNGTSGTNPGGGPGPLLYKIQLYKNSDSTDS